MKTIVETLEGSAVKLTITVPAEDVDAAIKDAYKRVSEKLRIPGFRKGKAPRPVIDNHVGRDYVLGEAQEVLVNATYGKALDAERIRPIANPEIDELDEVVPGEEYTYVAEVEVRPELTLTSLDGLSVEVAPGTASDKEVEGQINYVRDRFATLDLVDRGVEQTDFVLMSFVGKVDGEEYEGNAVDKYLYETGKGMMPAEFDEALLGAKAGEKVFVEFPIPDTSSNPEFIGKTATFDVEVHEVKAKILPALDDEFAATVGGFESYEAYADDVRAKLNQQKAIGYGQAVESGARAALAERLEGDVPESMINSTKEGMMRDFGASLESREMSFEGYLQMSGMTPEDLEADFKVQAENSVREELALEALFREQGFEVTDADLDDEIGKMAETSSSSAEELRAKWEETGVISVLHEQIMHRKAVMWLMDEKNVEVIEKEPEVPGDEDSTEE